MATISHAIRIRAPRERVFEALTTAASLRSWYTPHVEGEYEVDKEITLRFDDGTAFRWQIEALTAGAEVRLRCVAGPGAASGTGVVHRLADAGDGRTALETDHTDWPEDDKSLPTCNTLWGILLGRLRDHVEAGASSGPTP